MTEAFKNVMEALHMERTYQKMKNEDSEHTVAEWLLIMETLLEKAKLAWYYGLEGRESALCEVLQLTAVGVACLEQFGSDTDAE